MAFNKDNFDNIMSRLENIKIQGTDIFLKYKEDIIRRIPMVKAYVASNRETFIKAIVPMAIVVAGFYACSTSQEKIERNMKDIFEL